LDESFREHETNGVYVLAACVLAPLVSPEVRDLMLRLRGVRRTDKLHWHEMDRAQQKEAAKRLADVDGVSMVAIGVPVPRRRQERARAMCLAALVPELHNLGVRQMLAEARTSELNRRDVRVVSEARFALPKGTDLRIDHLPGRDEPLLWAADVVAGAVRTSYDGNSTYRDIFADRIYEIRVRTGC
jgi:hypothetical protein